MSSRLTVAILASAVLMQGTAWGQESKPGEDPNQVLPQQIREKLTEQGYKDVKVTPGSFVVSARDQDGNRIMMLIGPTETTMMKVPDDYPSQAQAPDKDEIIQQ